GAAQIQRLAEVEGPAGRVLQHVHARRRRRLESNTLPRAAPDVASILEHQRLRHEAARELGRRAADAEHLRREALMIGGVAHLGEPREESVSQHPESQQVTMPSAFGRAPSLAERLALCVPTILLVLSPLTVRSRPSYLSIP